MSPKTFTYSTLGQYFRLCRLTSHLHQSDVAKAVKTSEQTISNMENDRAVISSGLFLKLRNFYKEKNVPPLDFDLIEMKNYEREDDEVKPSPEPEPLPDPNEAEQS